MNYNSVHYLLIMLTSFTLHGLVQAQTSKKWELSGYQKSLQGLLSFEDPTTQRDTLLTDIFLHNRLNFKWFPTETFTFKAELRTRFFFGQFHQSTFSPNFKEQLKNDGNDFFNLQLISTGAQTVVHSIFDRLYLMYTKKDWEISVGRQRINWGIGTLWNPHDVFNAFSFTNFDYEERLGVDAIHVKKYIGYSGGVELAIKAYNNLDDFVAGLVYKINKWDYDFQFLGGYARRDIVMGLGWAGSIKDIGFKGEMSYFKTTSNVKKNTFTGTIELDYGFKKGTYLNVGVLYNATDNTDADIFNFQLSSRNLYPYKWATSVTVSHPLTPLFQGSLTAIYSPVKGQPLYLGPTLTYSISENLDVDVIGQFFLETTSKDSKFNTNIGFLRMKYSF